MTTSSNWTSQKAPDDCSLLVQNTTDQIDDSITCINDYQGNGNACLTVSNSSIYTSTSSSIQCLNKSSQGGNASIVIDQSIITLLSNASLVASNQANTGQVHVTINESILSLGGALICSNQTAAHGVTLDITNSTVSIEKDITCSCTASTQGAGDVMIFLQNSIVTGGAMTCQNRAPGKASVRIENSSLTLTSLITTGVTGKGSIHFISGTLTSSGPIIAKATYQQSSLATLQLTLPATLSAHAVTLGGALIIDCANSHTNTTLIQSALPLNSKFATTQFINVPEGVTPHLSYTKTTILISFT